MTSVSIIPREETVRNVNLFTTGTQLLPSTILRCADVSIQQRAYYILLILLEQLVNHSETRQITQSRLSDVF